MEMQGALQKLQASFLSSSRFLQCGSWLVECGNFGQRVDPLSWKELISLMVYFLLNLGSLPCTLCFMFYLSPILVFLKLLRFKIGIFPRFIFDRIWLVLPCLQLRFSADFSQLFGTIFVQREFGLCKILFLSSKRNSSLKFQWRNCRSSF